MAEKKNKIGLCRWIAATTGIALVVAGICLIGFQCCIHDATKLEMARI